MRNPTIASPETDEIAETALREWLDELPGEARRELLQKVGVLMAEQRQRERERCVGMCLHRAELWRTTRAASSSVAIAREEARARANEAHYLADLLASGTGLPELSSDGGADA